MNWSLEVFVYIVSTLIIILNLCIILPLYLKNHDKILLSLLFQSLFLLFFMLGGIFQYLFLSIAIFQIQALIMIPAGISTIVLIDLVKNNSVDAKKSFLFGATAMGLIFALYNPSNIIDTILITGDPTLKAQGSLIIWGTLIGGQLSLFFFYYALSVYRKGPYAIKSKAILPLFGGFIYICPIFLYILRLTGNYPGIIGFSMALGSFLIILSFKLEYQSVKVSTSDSKVANMEMLSKIISLCAHCKNIKDFDEEWIPIEQFFHKNSKMLFSHGICPICFKEHYPDFHED